jgi:hypothetical protein
MSFEEEVASDLAYGFRRHADFYLNTYKELEEKDRAAWRSRVIKNEQTFGLRRIDDSADLRMAEYLDAHPTAVPHIRRFLEIAKENASLKVMSPDGKQETRGQAELREAALLITRGLDKAEGPFFVAVVLGAFNEIFPNDPAKALRWAEVVGFPAELLSLHGEARWAGRENAESIGEAIRAERSPTAGPMPGSASDQGAEEKEDISAERSSSPREAPVPGIGEIIRRNADGDWARGLYTLETRIFTPGDNRGFATAPDASARLHASATLSPGTAGASEVRTHSDMSQERAAEPGKRSTGKGEPVGTIETRRIGDGTADKGTGADYHVSLVASKPGVSGLEGMNTQAQVSLLRQPGLLTVTMTLYGTGSSANEWTLRDSSGKAVFLAGHMPAGATNVSAKDKSGAELSTGSLTMLLGVDQHGRFTGILGAEFKDGKGKVLAAEANRGIDQWNQGLAKALTPANMPAPERGQADREASAAKQRQAIEHAKEGTER